MYVVPKSINQCCHNPGYRIHTNPTSTVHVVRDSVVEDAVSEGVAEPTADVILDETLVCASAKDAAASSNILSIIMMYKC